MCLRSDTDRPVKADKAITCYKVVRKENSYGKPLFKSIHFSFIYELGKRYKNRKFKHYEPTGFVYDGFHSYANELHAEDTIWPLWRGINEVIIRCEIPAGSWYYKESMYGDFGKEYCSDRIRVVAWKEYEVKAGKWGEWQYAPKYRLYEYLKKIWPFT